MTGKHSTLGSWRTVFALSATFAAYLMGSGFATGQEAMQFFGAHGSSGLAGITLVFCCFMYACYTLMSTGQRLGLTRNEDVFRHYCGSVVGVFLTWYTMVFIVAVHAVMLSGAGAALAGAFSAPPLLGSVTIMVLVATTLLLGLGRIIDVMSLVGPLVIGLTLTTALVSLLRSDGDLSQANEQIMGLELLKASDHWTTSSLLYVGLAMLGLASFLPALGAGLASRNETLKVALLGPALFSVSLAGVVAALILGIEKTQSAGVPLLALASELFTGYEQVLALVIFLSIYSTATPLLWTVVVRLSAEGTRAYQLWVLALSGIGLAGAFLLPFAKLVNIIYPTVGYAGLLFLSCAIVTDLRRTRLRASGS